jgi:hypothetical protein
MGMFNPDWISIVIAGAGAIVSTFGKKRVRAFGVGLITLGAIGFVVSHYYRIAEAQDPTIINNAPSINTQNQSGGSNTIIITTPPAPPKFAFDPAIADDILKKLPPGKPIRLRSIGPDSDQAIASQYLEYLKARGVRVPFRDMIGVMFPSPTKKISISEDGAETVLTIAPSAH